MEQEPGWRDDSVKFRKNRQLEADHAAHAASIVHEVKVQRYGEERKLIKCSKAAAYEGRNPTAQASFAAKRARLKRSNPAATQTVLWT
jgi:hypothetical protein